MIIEDKHFEYLVLQTGSIDELKDNRQAWEIAYWKRLQDIYDSIKDVLPWTCNRVLDIGSGLGGIHCYLLCPETYLLDGLADPPRAVDSYHTFNSMDVAHDFLVKNGVTLAGWYTPRDKPKPPMKFDLILSFASWCFHYNPETYLQMVKDCSRVGTVVVVDVRKDYKTWRRVLKDALGLPQFLAEDKKSVRLAFTL